MGPHIPEKALSRQKRAKSSVTQQWIIRLRSKFVQSLNAWHPKCCKSSRSRGQRSRSQHNITYQHQKTLHMDKLSKVKLGENYPRAGHITLHNVQGHKVRHWNHNNSAVNCSIAFKFGTEFYHITSDTLQMFKVRGQRSRSQRKVMYQQQKRYNMAKNGFSEFKLGMASWKGWRVPGGLKLKCIRNCYVF